MMPRALALVIAVLLSGCTLIPDYERPAMPVTDQWQSTDADNTAQAPAEIAWQSFFTSPALQRVIQTALDNNRDLRIASLNVEAARALYRISRAELAPALSIDVAGNRQKVSAAQSNSNPLFGNVNREYISSSYSANLATTAFELDLFGQLRSQNEAALQTFFATQAARDTAHISLIAETANAYLQWQADKKILQLTSETLAAQSKSFDLIQQRVNLGAASQLDLAQSRIAMESARANHAIYARQVTQDRNALRVLLGSDTSLLDSDISTLDTLTLDSALASGIASETLLQRPDVRKAEHGLIAANANIGAARAAYFPSLTLTGTYGFASSRLSTLFSSEARGAWSFTPQLTIPLFSAGGAEANLEYSKLQKQAAVANYEKTLQLAFREVADQLAARQSLADELAARRALIDAASQVYALALARYRQGIDSFLNVLDAQYVWFSAQQDAIAVSKAQLANQVNLYKALGGGQVTLAPAQDAAAYIDTSQHAQHAVTDNSSILVIDTNHP